MAKLSDITPVDFPRIPESILSNDEARSAIAKASAYITFALEEGNIEHERDPHAAFVTDATYSLKENCTPKEYLEFAIQELAYAEGEVDDKQFQKKLQEFRNELQSAV